MEDIWDDICGMRLLEGSVASCRLCSNSIALLALVSFFALVKRGRVAAEARDTDNEERQQLNLAQTQL